MLNYEDTLHFSLTVFINKLTVWFVGMAGLGQKGTVFLDYETLVFFDLIDRNDLGWRRQGG